MTESSVASAVAPPSPTESPAQTAGTKRDAPGDNEANSASPKRQRRDIENEDSVRNNAEHPKQPGSNSDQPRSPDRRKTSRPGTDELDRRRNKRLFGGLLSTLSQKPSNTSAQRRRQEIETRKREELSKREAELESRQQERTARLFEIRRRAQRRVDERNMRVRHASMRARAGFLMTESEPRIYWRPWEMRPEEEARVQTQTEEVAGEILRETEEFEDTRRRWAEEDAKESVMGDEGNEDGGNRATDHTQNSNNEDGSAGSHVDGEGVAGLERDSAESDGQETQKLDQEHMQHEREADRRLSMEDVDEAAVDTGEDTLVF